jgi:hypothetical protein
LSSEHLSYRIPHVESAGFCGKANVVCNRLLVSTIEFVRSTSLPYSIAIRTFDVGAGVAATSPPTPLMIFDQAAVYSASNAGCQEVEGTRGASRALRKPGTNGANPDPIAIVVIV